MLFLRSKRNISDKKIFTGKYKIMWEGIILNVHIFLENGKSSVSFFKSFETEYGQCICRISGMDDFNKFRFLSYILGHIGTEICDGFFLNLCDSLTFLRDQIPCIAATVSPS